MYLHPNNGVDEEEHSNEQTDIRQRFEGLDKGPEKYTDCVSLPEEFNQPSGTKQSQETQTGKLFAEFRDQSVNDAADDCDEIKHIPCVSKVVLHKHIKGSLCTIHSLLFIDLN
jgi:hypothetical protein